jgi:metal-responsive CopG/Arc/MetJ family transcriptional regulator
MANVKTAISLKRSLFERVDALARELQIPRSRLFALAAEDFIRRYENQQLLDAINAAYEDQPDPDEKTVRDGMRLRHRQLVEGEW